jgi:hypothetical protein
VVQAGQDTDSFIPAMRLGGTAPEQGPAVQPVERVDVRIHGVDVRLRPNGLAGLVREVAGNRRAAE